MLMASHVLIIIMKLMVIEHYSGDIMLENFLFDLLIVSECICAYI